MLVLLKIGYLQIIKVSVEKLPINIMMVVLVIMALISKGAIVNDNGFSFAGQDLSPCVDSLSSEFIANASICGAVRVQK